MKAYITNEELLAYLKSKNVTINNEEQAKKLLEKYTYYSIVNSYKTIFKDKNNNYIDNVSFEEIYALYDFDKKIKNIFLKYCLEIETVIKSLMANQISRAYGIKSYLDVNNLDLLIPLNKRENLINRINDEIKKDYKVHYAITHYLDNHGFIPPFVLVKILTFGIASSYYGALKQSDRQAIAKYFNISDKLLKQALKLLTIVRNLSAHVDRLYSFSSKFYLSFQLIDKNYKTKNNITNLYMVMCCMGLLLEKEQYNEFQKEINEQISILSSKLKSININDILKVMGYPNV